LLNTVRSHLPLENYVTEQSDENRHVLVVDDDASQLKLLATYLKQQGFDVATATDGNDALTKARACKPDAIVSDVLMPSMDGFQLCIEVRADPDLAHIPVASHNI
jgi:two-component system OmpR family response regulator